MDRQPVVATTIIATNNTNADTTGHEYKDEIGVLEPMSITTYITSVKAGNVFSILTGARASGGGGGERA
ncbi:hypothetical protein LTR37_010336 [Vermiconidia calcicola]|uniref:Uncharacterized protein n=1 Tax=Vermiconidia calcicola TaxID=1690605 RepID=A0ACC3N7X2_9PEZI|nr:hypothetical protein LTR37_010336 [Vermiconidia calcicola]